MYGSFLWGYLLQCNDVESIAIRFRIKMRALRMNTVLQCISFSTPCYAGTSEKRHTQSCLVYHNASRRKQELQWEVSAIS